MDSSNAAIEHKAGNLNVSPEDFQSDFVVLRKSVFVDAKQQAIITGSY